MVNTFFKCFLNYLQPYLTGNNCIKDTDRDTYILAVDIKNTYARDIYTKDTCIKNIFYAKNSYIKNIFIGNAYIKSIYYIRDTSIRSFYNFYIIKY